MLRTITEAVHLLGLVVSLWLGIYIVSRNYRRVINWLTALTLWSIAGVFLNVILALNPPPTPAYFPIWLRIFLPFWSEDILTGPSNAWLQGWSVTLGVAFWHHATILMRPGHTSFWRVVRIAGGYVLAGAAVLLQVYTPFILKSGGGDPLYLNTLRAGPYYLFFAVSLLLYMAFSLINLVRSARISPWIMPRRQLLLLAIATLIGGVAGPIGIAGSAFGIPIPIVLISVLLLLSVTVIGYGVARYSALLEGRAIRRDFLYNFVSILAISIIYGLLAWVSMLVFSVPGIIFLFFVILAIITHNLLDISRNTLDYVFFQRNTRTLRARLRSLARLAGDADVIAARIEPILEMLCDSVRATYGVVLLFSNTGETEVQARYRWRVNTDKVAVPRDDFLADDVSSIEPGNLGPPFEEAALIVPLYEGSTQFGALIMGHPINGVQFSQTDIDTLLYPSDLLSETIIKIKQSQKRLHKVSSILEMPERDATDFQDIVNVKDVENALRNLHNFAYLGDHPLTHLRLVRQTLHSGPITHIDRGKAVYKVLENAIQKLRPVDEISADPPAREWYSYLILHEAYFEGIHNRDIMVRLFISEGTFNRIRRRAVRAVTRMIQELEVAAHSQRNFSRS